GWFFMGSKRRENYDDWWRCEINFDPTLDELFGITHAKQAVVPTEALSAILSKDLEPIGRALNSPARQRFELVKLTASLNVAESQAARDYDSLRALPRVRDEIPHQLRELISGRPKHIETGAPYELVVAELDTTAAFEVFLDSGRLLVALNAR